MLNIVPFFFSAKWKRQTSTRSLLYRQSPRLFQPVLKGKTAGATHKTFMPGQVTQMTPGVIEIHHQNTQNT